MESRESLREQVGAIPWCERLLGDESLVFETPDGRQGNRTRGKDALISQTLNTKDSIPLYVVAYQPPRQPETPISEAKAILKLAGGINGFPNTCHGGIVATILDEIMGELINVNLKHRAILRTSYMTAYLNTTYLKPVRTPGTILARARLSKIEGTKLYQTATIEDGEGTVLAKADALFIGLKHKL